MTKLTVSTCVDCSMPIIGDRLHCPACLDSPMTSWDVTVARDTFLNSMVRWLIGAELFCILALGLALAVKGCL